MMLEAILQDVCWFHSINAQSRLETYFDKFIIIRIDAEKEEGWDIPC